MLIVEREPVRMSKTLNRCASTPVKYPTKLGSSKRLISLHHAPQMNFIKEFLLLFVGLEHVYVDILAWSATLEDLDDLAWAILHAPESVSGAPRKVRTVCVRWGRLAVFWMRTEDGLSSRCSIDERIELTLRKRRMVSEEFKFAR